ncbi:OB-fold protein [Achromobacter xylosoxidans]
MNVTNKYKIILKDSLGLILFLALGLVSPTRAAPPYVMSPLEANILASLEIDERAVFAAGGDTYIGDYLGVVRATATEVAKTYASNEVAGDQAYYKKSVLLRGVISSVRSGLGNTPYVVLHAGAYRQVQAKLVEGSAERAAQLKIGEKLALMCQGGGSIAGIPMFKACQFADTVGSEAWRRLASDIRRIYAGEVVRSETAITLAVILPTVASLLPKSTCRTPGQHCQENVSLVLRDHEHLLTEMQRVAIRLKGTGISLKPD